MRRFILGALLSVPLLVSPLWAKPEHGGSHHGGSHHGDGNRYYGYGRGYGYGWGYGYGTPYRSWYVAPMVVAPTYVVPEYRATPAYRGDADALVSAWYQRYLGRDMDPGASGWIDQVRIGADPSTVLCRILASDEYYQRGGATPSGFVERLYVDVADRRPSREEMDSTLNRMASVDRQGVAYEMLRQHPEAVMIG